MSSLRGHAFRLPPGADLRAALEAFAREHAIAAGCILTCVGSLSSTRLRMPGSAGAADRFLDLDEPVEIVSLTGTLGVGGVHLHLSISRTDGACLGGHLVDGCTVRTTAEVVIGDLPEVEFRREFDPATGYAELNPRPHAGEELWSGVRPDPPVSKPDRPSTR